MVKKNTQFFYAPNEKVFGNSILRLRSDLAYVLDMAKIGDAAIFLEENPQIHALGVTDQDHRVRGVISRTRLFSLLGKPFGRDILSKRSVAEITAPTESFIMYENIFRMADKVLKMDQKTHEGFYLLVDENQRFRGIFSYGDVVSYLSQITQDDIKMASDLQSRMVKDQDEWKSKHWNAQALSRSAKGVGGDFYFYKEMAGNRHFFCLGDVSGKGVAASILTSLVWGILRTYDYKKGLPKLLHLINDALIETFHLEKYLTGIFMIWCPDHGSVKLADMGHGHSGLWRKNRGLKLRLPQSNLPLGIEKEINPKLYKLALHPGDHFFAYSDGFTEQENSQGEEFGEVEMLKVLKSQDKHWKKTPQKLWESVTQWREEIPQQDDMTWLQLSVLKD